MATVAAALMAENDDRDRSPAASGGIFGAEESILSAARSVAAGPLFTTAETRQAYDDLVAAYDKLFREQRRLVRLSDRYQARLNELNKALEADLDAARTLQQLMLPQGFPERADADGAAAMIPARQVGGDFYDFIELDDDRLGLVMADVCGKGVGAAFFMAVARTFIRQSARLGLGPSAALAEANRRLCRENPAELFVTVFYAVLRPRDGLLRYANCGHLSPYRITPSAGVQELSSGSGGSLPLGVMPDSAIPEDEVVLRPGEMLFLFTDGVTDAEGPGGEQYGEGRLETFLRAAADCSPEQTIRRLLSEIDAHRRGAEATDDITCVAVRRLRSGAD